ncbi:hypothetical protein CPB83DRAFT_862451 [Crepidotus variabilis]|uniref:Protein kinase domain-containing protein n=1 Tax=Crepidotus variabilis TaxID=179855 RepID=A0A9P6JKA3_9AGAR|nr:hypothetical protein CPB83DRAFT_862451 [Crepidotus variabilis]
MNKEKKRSPSSTPTARPTPLPETSSNAIVKVPSPLNPNSTPTKNTVPLPLSDDPTPPTVTFSPSQRVRKISGKSMSNGGTLAPGMSSMGRESSTSSLPKTLEAEGMRSTFRERSRSPARTGNSDLTAQGKEEAAIAKMGSSWWAEKHVSRGWPESPKRKQTTSKEQADAFQSTREKVAQAAVSVLGTTTDIVHEVLTVGVEFLDLAPIPGLQTAAKTLLGIWDAAQAVDMNRLSCLRLTERCADILISIRLEIHEAGDVVEQELEAPISKLEESYLTIYRFMDKQVHRPWLKRYLKRDEIMGEISGCDVALRDALALFNISIQIRILRNVQDAEHRRQAEMSELMAMVQGHLPLADGDRKVFTEHTEEPEDSEGEHTSNSDSVTDFAATTNALGLFDSADDGSRTPTTTLASTEVIPTLQSIHAIQNSLDAALDLSELRQLLREALQTSSDADMVEVLQIKRQEMPDAIKSLQRAYERLAERDGDVDSVGGKGVLLGKVVRRVSVKEVEGNGGLKRSTTIVSIESTGSSSEGDSAGSNTEIRKRDTLDREFIESGIDALTRMSRGAERSLPSWTITKYEVDRDEKIGVGFFSDVFKGTWRGRTVAIKILAESTPRKLFVREVGIWKTLRHANVLSLYGASSATGDPPWFFVSPYLKNGSLVQYLKRIEVEVRPSGLGLGPGASVSSVTPQRSPGNRAVTMPQPSRASGSSIITSHPESTLSPSASTTRPSRDGSPVQREWDLFRFMHEVAKGMEYLHGKGVLHGDLKAANVLVDDKFRCVISDFGQSEMKSEAFRISGEKRPHGTLRWLSPELMDGIGQMTQAADVWAFSICCVEILTMGRMPWQLLDDETVRSLVLRENTRPPIPKHSRFNTPGLQDILRNCWNTKPDLRPQFSKIARDFRLLRKSFGQDLFESPRLPPIEDLPEQTSSPSPDMRPSDNLPSFLRGLNPIPQDILHGSTNPEAADLAHKGGLPTSDISHHESTVSTGEIRMPEQVIYTPGPSNSSSRRSSVFVHHPEPDSGHIKVVDFDGYESPPPTDERAAAVKNERRYRLLLTHDYHPSLTLPLWEPTPVDLGAVGYLSRPSGEFVTLFNAYRPVNSSHPSIQRLPSIEGYGRPSLGLQRQDRRTVTQKAFDLFNGGSLSFKNSSKQVARRYPFALKNGHKVAYLCTEITQYEYIETLDAPKKWFQLHADTIMQAYGRERQIQKEDLFLVIGTLKTPNYGLFVSHSHPEGHVHFNVYANSKAGQPWGTFTTDSDVAGEVGPSYDSDELETPRLSASKVSVHGDPTTAVLIARLRFKPDASEATSR